MIHTYVRSDTTRSPSRCGTLSTMPCAVLHGPYAVLVVAVVVVMVVVVVVVDVVVVVVVVVFVVVDVVVVVVLQNKRHAKHALKKDQRRDSC